MIVTGSKLRNDPQEKLMLDQKVPRKNEILIPKPLEAIWVVHYVIDKNYIDT